MKQSAQEWANALGLKKQGSNFVGPCPRCGGNDRFSVIDRGDVTLVSCRGCLNGEASDVRRKRYFEIVEDVFGKDHSPKKMSQEERRKLHEEVEKQEKRRAIKQMQVSKRVQRMIEKARIHTHPYLEEKGFPEYKMLVLDDQLLVPLRDDKNTVWTAQTIDSEGAKKFLPGGRVKECSYRIGRGREVWIVEGLATGLSVFAALRRIERDITVECAFSTTNLPEIAKRYKHSFVVADHDENNAGEVAAKNTKRPFWIPPSIGDANDFHQTEGLKQLANELSEWVNEQIRKRRKAKARQF